MGGGPVAEAAWIDQVRDAIYDVNVEYVTRNSGGQHSRPQEQLWIKVEVNPGQRSLLRISSTDLHQFTFTANKDLMESPVGVEYVKRLAASISLRDRVLPPDEAAIIAYDASRGDLRSKALMLDLQREMLARYKDQIDSGSSRTEWGKLAQALEKDLQEVFSEAGNAYDRGMERYQARLRELPDEASLRKRIWELWADSDRAGVAKLFRDLLPWEVMKPSDTDLWEHHLKALARADFDDSFIYFRGMPQDFEEASPERHWLPRPEKTKMQFSWPLRRFVQGESTLQELVGLPRPGGVTAYRTAFPQTGFMQDLMTRRIHHSLGAVDSKTVVSPHVSVSEITSGTRKFALDHDGQYRSGVVKVYRLNRDRVLKAAIHYQAENEEIVPLGLFPDEYLGRVKASADSNQLYGRATEVARSAEAEGKVPSRGLKVYQGYDPVELLTQRAAVNCEERFREVAVP
ncbi:MAG: hypothetical protein NDJ90_09655 [Oligoflexia bacterium]|nr:hypothetical protein [Oligoflexia bacterium]